MVWIKERIGVVKVVTTTYEGREGVRNKPKSDEREANWESKAIIGKLMTRN